MLKNNKLNLLISIVCAIALWAYITNVVDPPTERAIGGVQVELAGIDALNDKGFTVAEDVSHTVDVTVTGARSEVLKLKPADFKATADMTGYRRGTVKVPVNIILPANIELVQVRPKTINVEVVDLITVFKPVLLEFEGEFERNQEPGFIRVMPEEMEVSGVAEAVDNIGYIRAVVPEGALTEELSSIRIDVDAIDKDRGAVSNVGLSQNSVEVTGMLCYTKRVPLRVETIGEPKESVEVTDKYIPGTVSIRGSAEAIEGITEVYGRPVDLSEITMTEETPLEEILTLPEGVELAENSKDLSVRVEVQGIARKEFTFTADMIEVTNLAPLLSGHVNTGSVTVTVLATREVLDEIKIGQIKLHVDAYEFRRAGSAEMEVVAECEIDVKGIEIEPKKVRVTLIKE